MVTGLKVAAYLLAVIGVVWVCMPNCFCIYIFCFVPPFLEQPDKYWKEELKRLKAKMDKFTEVAAIDVPQGLVNLEMKLPDEIKERMKLHAVD